MTYQTIVATMQPPLMCVQIARPEANNSINSQLVTEITHALKAAEANSECRLFVLEGSEQVFCSGNDFQALSASDAEELSGRENVYAYYDLLAALGSTSLISVAMVTGNATAGGVGFASACDLVFARPGVTFALSELLFGLLPACVLPYLIRRVGYQRARRMALTTQPISAETAQSWGLVDECSADPARALKLLSQRLACLDPEAVVRLKTYLAQLDPFHSNPRELAVSTITPLLSDDDIRQRISRFVNEGRYPWQA